MINAPWEMACVSSMIPGEAGPAERPAPLSGSVTLTLRNTIATTTGTTTGTTTATTTATIQSATIQSAQIGSRFCKEAMTRPDMCCVWAENDDDVASIAGTTSSKMRPR